MEPHKDIGSKSDIEKRQMLWDQMGSDIDKAVERSGWDGIEPGIRDLIIGLNIIGLKTDQSCEGYELNYQSPWVTFRNFNDDLYDDPKMHGLVSLIGEFNESSDNLSDSMVLEEHGSPFLYLIAIKPRRRPTNEETAAEEQAMLKVKPISDYGFSQMWKIKEFEGVMETRDAFSAFVKYKYINEGFQL